MTGRRTPAPWLAVTGGKGGVGKTVVAVNLAILAAKAGYRTLLVDLDPGLANVDVHLRLAPRFTIEDLARGRCTHSEAILRGPGGISVLAGASGSTALAGADSDLLQAVHRVIEEASTSFDLVVCDTGAGIGPAVLRTAERAQMVLAVTTPDPAAATDTYALAKLLIQGSQKTPHLLVNRVANRDQAMRAGTRLAAVTQKFLGVRVPLAGWLTRRGEIAQSITRQHPFALTRDHEAAEDLRALTATVLSSMPAKRSKRASRRTAGVSA